MWAISRRADIRAVGWTSTAYTETDTSLSVVKATIVLVAGGPGNHSFVSSRTLDQTLAYRCFTNAGSP
jgi:hypothetical protein